MNKNKILKEINNNLLYRYKNDNRCFFLRYVVCRMLVQTERRI